MIFATPRIVRRYPAILDGIHLFYQPGIPEGA
jgi:hypothetical protein